MKKIFFSLLLLTFLGGCGTIDAKDIDKCIGECEINGGLDRLDLTNGRCCCKNGAYFDLWAK